MVTLGRLAVVWKWGSIGRQRWLQRSGDGAEAEQAALDVGVAAFFAEGRVGEDHVEFPSAGLREGIGAGTGRIIVEFALMFDPYRSLVLSHFIQLCVTGNPQPVSTIAISSGVRW